MLRILGDLRFRLRALFRSRAAQRELDEELAFHLAMDAEALRARGLSPEDADREARRRFGSLGREAERTRDAWGISLARELAADVRHAARQMRRRPAFSAIVVLTLGAGIGATVALFSVVYDLLVRPLPYRDAGRIQVFWMTDNWRGEEYDFLRERPGVFASIAAFSTNGAPYQPTTHGGGGAALLPFVVSTSSLFDVLDARPMLGRAFEASDDRPGAPPVIVISYGTWQQDLGGDPAVIGREILLDGAPVTVVGVMPKGFFFPTPNYRAWRPLRLDPSTETYHDVGYLTLLGRARPDVSPTLLHQDVERLARSLGERFSYTDAADKAKHASAIPIRDYLFGSVRAPLMLLLAAVALLLGIACANAAALILARTSDRTGEMLVRAALGAGWGRLARQIAGESLVLATCAAVVGIVVATVGFRALVSRLPLSDGFDAMVAPGWTVPAAAFGLALAIAAAASAAPIRSLLRGQLGLAPSRERSEAGLRRGTRRAQGAIVAGQVAVAVLLVAGAMLLIRSVGRISAVDPGFDPHGVSTYTLVTRAEMTEAARRPFFHAVLARVGALPGVTAVGLTNRLPLRDGGYEGPVRAEGRPDLEGAKRPNSLYRTATPGYFRAMGMKLREGRGIDSSDVATSLPVVVLNESFARRMWPGRSAVGRHIITGYTGTQISRTVVGVLREPRLTSMTGDVPFAMFVPLEQHASNDGGVLVVRSTVAPVALMPTVRRAIASIDPGVAIARVETMDDVLARSLAQPLRLRFFLSVFAALAIALGTLGVYGVVSYAVARRRAEIAIRMALGASPARVRYDVVSLGLVPVIVGIALGLVASQALAGLLRRFLYGLAAADPASLGVAAGSLLLAGGLAALAPAVRAGRTSPAQSLRAE